MPAGSVLGLLCPNGAGKTTVVRKAPTLAPTMRRTLGRLAPIGSSIANDAGTPLRAHPVASALRSVALAGITW
jgi:ABC-type multidrug transport system ATPase subunit